METPIKPLNTLIEKFRSLSGVGKKSAMRMAFSVLDMEKSDAFDFAQAILDAKTQIGLCQNCQNLSSEELCPICANDNRDHSVVCVVEDYQAVIAFEKVKEFNGVYHVLHGTISPLDGIGPNDINIGGLLSRINAGGVSEVIMATNPDVEGEATSMYISGLLKPLGIKVTRLAHGIPIGTDLEYADEVSLARAFVDRKTI